MDGMVPCQDCGQEWALAEHEDFSVPLCPACQRQRFTQVRQLWLARGTHDTGYGGGPQGTATTRRWMWEMLIEQAGMSPGGADRLLQRFDEPRPEARNH